MIKSFQCDFETTLESPTRVWLWASCDIDNIDDVNYDWDLDSFFEWCKKETKVLYYQNLRFDGEFIIHWLLTNDFKFRSTDLLGDEQFGENKKVKLHDNEFTSIISDDGKYYYIKVMFKEGKKPKYVEIYDGLKKIPFSVKDIAKTFKLDIKKGSLDYEKHLYYKEHPDEALDYIKNDVQIPAQGLKIQLDKGLRKMTIGADALNSYKGTIGNKFRQLFPVLSEQEDEFVRHSYKGGFCWVNPKYQGKTMGWGYVYDNNSMYPSRMRYCAMPIGYGIYGVGEYKKDVVYDLYVQHFKAKFKIKENHIPTIQIKNSRYYKENEYVTECKEMTEFWLTSVDFKLFLDQYDIEEIEHIDFYKYRSVYGVFNKYIDYWGEVKANSKGGLRTLAKLMLNNLYGKFSTNKLVKGKYPYLNEDGSVGYNLLEERTRQTVYIPVGSFITAYGRDLCIRTAQACYNAKPIEEIDFNTEHDIAYCDTDSVHCLGTGVPNIDIHESRLGAWKLENTFIKSRYLRQKTYLERLEQTIDNYDEDELTWYQRWSLQHGYYDDIKCCGMPQNVKNKLSEYDPFGVFYQGLEVGGKLMPTHVPGGILLKDTTFTIK